MANYIKYGKYGVGIGITEEEAIRDLEVVQSIRNSELTPSDLIQRRKELSPWLPLPNYLHISEHCALKYENGILQNITANIEIEIEPAPYGVVYYILKVIPELTYEDIFVCLRPEINEFFSNISEVFNLLEDYPIIYLLEASAYTCNPDIVYDLSDYVISLQENSVGMKFFADANYYMCDYKDDFYHLLSYLASRIGGYFNG